MRIVSHAVLSTADVAVSTVWCITATAGEGPPLVGRTMAISWYTRPTATGP